MTPTAATAVDRPAHRRTTTPDGRSPSEHKRRGSWSLLGVFVVVPFLAVIAAVPVAWGWGLGWTDIVLAVVFYVDPGFGITVGFHRYFTHGSFKAKRPLRIALAIAGSRWPSRVRSSAGSPTTASTTRSATRRATRTRPWRYGDRLRALTKGLFYAHMGWLFDVEQTNRGRSTRPTCSRTATSSACPGCSPRWSSTSLLLPGRRSAACSPGRGRAR